MYKSNQPGLTGEAEVIFETAPYTKMGTKELVTHKVLARRIPLPTLEEAQVPSNVFGADIRWMEGYGNSPDLFLWKEEDKEEKVTFTKYGKDTYIGERASGFRDIHYHNGALFNPTEEEVDRYRQQWNVPKELKILHSTMQEGYGGRHYGLTMSDGTYIILRGPWHGGGDGAKKAGYPIELVEVKVREPHGKYGNKVDPSKSMGFFGFYLPEELYLGSIVRFLPDCELWEIYDESNKALTWEIARKKWGKPKDILQEEHRKWMSENAPKYPTYATHGNMNSPEWRQAAEAATKFNQEHRFKLDLD